MVPSGEQLTYRELNDRANQLSHWLREAGLNPGDHIAFSIENRLEYLTIVWGCHYAGLYYTALSTRLNADESSYIVNDCGAKAFIASPKRSDVAASLINTTPKVTSRLSVGGPLPGHVNLDAVLADMSTDPLADRMETTDMLYSSGTTGRPKGIRPPLPEDPAIDAANALIMIAQALFKADPNGIYLSPAPLYHAAPLRWCMSMTKFGMPLVIMEKFDPET